MHDAADHVPVRSARNRVIDLLRLGDTYPLTDLNVIADRLKVPFGGVVPIPIVHAQSGVRYELCDPKGTPLGPAFAAAGQDATLVIDSPAVQEDVTYRIRATKVSNATRLPAQLPRFLREPAPVKVGLDTSLTIEVADAWLPGSDTPTRPALLDAALASPKPADPRLIPHGASIDVRVLKSQEGVQYSLILDGRDVTGPSRMGDLGALTLRSPALREDAVLQVRATKQFLASENREPETSPLDARLFVKVKADPGIAVSTAGDPIVDYNAGASIRIAGSQPSARYRAFVRPIPDRDFIRGSTAGVDVTTVPVPGEPAVQVREPAVTGVWTTPPGYVAINDVGLAGTGADITLPLPACTEDAMVIVQAVKAHRVQADREDGAVVESAVRLDQAAVVLVRPDPDRRLSLRVPLSAGRFADDVQVSGGQPGVMYAFRDQSTDQVIPRAAYFHKRDEEDATQNKGIGQLGVEVDLIVPADTAVAGPTDSQIDRARNIPRLPQVAFGDRAAETTLLVRAVKAQTRVGVAMAAVASVPAMPVVRAEAPAVDVGTATTIVIEASRTGERYELVSNGVARVPALEGTGDALSISTGPLTASTVFQIVVTRHGDPGMIVERVVSVPIAVRGS